MFSSHRGCLTGQCNHRSWPTLTTPSPHLYSSPFSQLLLYLSPDSQPLTLGLQASALQQDLRPVCFSNLIYPDAYILRYSTTFSLSPSISKKDSPVPPGKVQKAQLCNPELNISATIIQIWTIKVACSHRIESMSDIRLHVNHCQYTILLNPHNDPVQ